MPTRISVNDILWTQSGDPLRVDKFKKNTGEVVLDNDFKKIQDVAQNGIKNGLNPNLREAYQTTLSNLENNSKKEEIQDLFDKISAMKKNHVDSKLVQYLESELKFKIVREDIKPEGYEEDPVTLGV